MNKNSLPIVFLVIIGLAVILYNYLGLSNLIFKSDSTGTTNPTLTPLQKCPNDTKLCPDGTTLYREPPECTFELCDNTGLPQITALVPNSGSVGDTIEITGFAFTTGDTVVKFGPGYIYGATLIDENTLEFVVPDGYELCAPGQENCPGAYPRTEKGTHEVYILNSKGKSNTFLFEVL